MNSRELDRSPSTLNFGGGAVSLTLAERADGSLVHVRRAPLLEATAGTVEREASKLTADLLRSAFGEVLDGVPDVRGPLEP